MVVFTSSIDDCYFVADGLMEATLSPVRSPKQLKVVTLVLALSVPVVSSASLFIRMVDVMVGSIVRADR